MTRVLCRFSHRAKDVERVFSIIEDIGIPQDEVGHAQYRGECVVEIMRDAAGHLADRVQSFLFDGIVMSFPQFL